MAILEYVPIATKTLVKDGQIHVIHACEGGNTVRMIYWGLKPLIAIMEVLKTEVLQIEDKTDE